IQHHRTKLEEMVIHRTAELSDEKAKLQAILDHVPSAIVLLDKDFRIQSASAEFSVITGHRFEDVKGSDCRAVFYSNGFCQECVCRKAMRTGKTESHIDATQTPNMRERFIEHIAIPMTDNGTVDSILEIITDVTERKRFEQNLLRAERLAAAGEMSAIIAHEFRNSLTSIKMILQLQNESTRLRRTEKKSLNVAMNAIEEMEQVVTQMLDFARPKPMLLKEVSLNHVVNESLSLVFPQMMKQEINIRKELEESLPLILLDEASMKEAIMNILLNAIQAISSRDDRTSGGEIFILTKNEQLSKTLRDFAPTERSINFSGNEMGTEIVLKKGTSCIIAEIRDNGSGIERQLLQRIFDPFFTTKTNGTGLGLPLVKRTVNAHGGIITVNGRKEQGTTFTLYLPHTFGT
ncbi:MAG: PAS domain S-box protein, partial [Ignavibacteriae bacterium]|nr:PAS domain S-box protein [Ignavibacteriota bacterium]